VSVTSAAEEERDEPKPTHKAPAAIRPMNSLVLFILAANLLPHRNAGPDAGSY
jgi:hypothetical protein